MNSSDASVDSVPEALLDKTDGSSQNKVHKAQSAYFVITILGLVNLFNYMDRTVFSILLESIKADLALSDSQMGLLGGFAFAAFYAVFGLLMGWVADRYNRVKVISISLFFWSLAAAACGVAQNFIQFFLARISIGVGEAGCVPSGHSIIGDSFSAEKRSFGVAIFTGIGLIGSLLGLSLSGFLLEQMSWRWVFICFGLPGAVFAFVVYFLVKEPGRGTVSHTASTPSLNMLASVKLALANKAMWHLLLATSLFFSLTGSWMWVPSFFTREYGISSAEFGVSGGLALGLGSIMGVFVGGVFANKLIARDRRWELWLPAAIAFAGVPLSGLVFWVGDLQLSIVLLFFSSFVTAMAMGPAMSSIQIFASSEVRATSVALMVFCTSVIGYGAAPTLVGVLSDLASQLYGLASNTALKIALSLSLLLPLWAAVHFLIAAKSLSVTEPEHKQ